MPKRRPAWLSVVGNRPQFVKLSAVAGAIRDHNRQGGRPVRHLILHTGQHYDDALSGIFFRQLGIPRAHLHLEVGSGPHGMMTGRMLERVEEALGRLAPRGVIVYGDTNSTLAGALAAAKSAIPVAHVEAGLRSGRRTQPEEINRVLTDRISDLLFCPTKGAVALLRGEGISRGVHFTGDVMYDVAKAFSVPDPRTAKRLGLPGRFVLATIHRQENADDPARLEGIARGLAAVSRLAPVLLLLHPRTRKALSALGAAGRMGDGVRLAEPLGFVETQVALRLAAAVVTDSGGLQKEAAFARVPCVTVRDETEWPETLAGGGNRLAAATEAGILRGVAGAMTVRVGPARGFGDGRAAARMVAILNREWR